MTGLRLRLLLAFIAAPLTALVLTAVITPTASAAEPRGTAFGAPCAQAQIIYIPGSNETTELKGMNDTNVGILKQVFNTIKEKTKGGTSVRIHVIGYPAAIVPLLNGKTDFYFASKKKGYQATWNTMEHYNLQCPGIKFILVGYSQGAHIAGDIAASIAKEQAPTLPKQLRAVHLLADPAREAHFTPLVGMPTGGGGGLELRGHRTFGSVSDRTIEYCAAGDGVCDRTPVNVARELAGIVDHHSGQHSKYATALVPGTKTKFTERVKADVINDVLLLNNPHF